MRSINLKSILAQLKSVIFLDGDLPPEDLLQDDILASLKTTNIIADGAIQKIQNIPVSAIVGDMDSQDSYPQNPNIPFIKNNDQNTTDFDKCIAYAEDTTLLPALILGIGGGEIDHVLNNIFTFAKYNKPESLFFLHYVPERPCWQIGFIADQDTQISGLTSNAYTSLIPLPSATLSSTGLDWELDNHKLDISGSISARNRTKSNACTLSIKEGKILFITDFYL